MSRSNSTPPSKKAGNTDRWTEILFRALSARVARRWRFVSFRGSGGGEWRGIVDVLAIRKDTSHLGYSPLKPGDLFEIILVQMKGGSARKPTREGINRLKAFKRRYGAKAIVLFSWRRKLKKHTCEFSKLSRGEWTPASPRETFG